MSKYDGANANRICSGGGQVRVTLSSNEGQGNDGTSLACKGCWVQAADSNTDVVRMAIDATASDSVGIDLGRPHISDGDSEYGSGACQPMWVPIDDVASLYFYSGDDNAIIDILYLVG